MCTEPWDQLIGGWANGGPGPKHRKGVDNGIVSSMSPTKCLERIRGDLHYRAESAVAEDSRSRRLYILY